MASNPERSFSRQGSLMQRSSTRLELATNSWRETLMEKKRQLRRKTTSQNVMEEEIASYAPVRRCLAKTINSTMFESAMCFLVLFNVVVIVLETSDTLQCYGLDDACVPQVYSILNLVLLFLYTCELVVTIFVQRSDVFFHGWSMLDLVIVCLGYLEIAVSFWTANATDLSLIRILKMARVLRIVRLLKPIPELYKLVVGFMSTMRTMFWGFVIIMILLGVWTVITVQIITPMQVRGTFESEWCNMAFDSVFTTLVLFFQNLVAGDSWGNCVIPIVTEHPVMFAYFGFSLVTVQLGLTNLILAVIVDASADAREDNARTKRKNMQKKREEAIVDLRYLMKRLDVDDSGTISLEEMREGFANEEQLQTRLSALGIDQGDLSLLMTLMDSDDSGTVDYEEFTSALIKAEQHDPRVQSMFLGLQIEKLSYAMHARFDSLETKLAHLMHQDPLQQASQNFSRETSPDSQGAHCADRKLAGYLHGIASKRSARKNQYLRQHSDEAAAEPDSPLSVEKLVVGEEKSAQLLHQFRRSEQSLLSSTSHLSALALEASQHVASLLRQSDLISRTARCAGSGAKEELGPYYQNSMDMESHDVVSNEFVCEAEVHKTMPTDLLCRGPQDLHHSPTMPSKRPPELPKPEVHNAACQIEGL